MGVNVGVNVDEGVCVPVELREAVCEEVDVCVTVGVMVDVSEGVAVTLEVGELVLVAVLDDVTVLLLVEDWELVLVAVPVPDGVCVGSAMHQDTVDTASAVRMLPPLAADTANVSRCVPLMGSTKEIACQSLWPSGVTCVTLNTTLPVPPMRPDATTAEPSTAIDGGAMVAESNNTDIVSTVPA